MSHQLIRVALQGVKGFPVRSLLTALSLIIGIVCLVSIFAATNTVEKIVLQNAVIEGGPGQTLSVGGFAGPLGLNDATNLANHLNTSHGAGISTAIRGDTALEVTTPDGTPSAAKVMFADEGLKGIHQFPLIGGSWLDNSAASISPRVVVNTLYVDQSGAAIGDKMTVYGADLASHVVVIQGIIQDGQDQPSVYVGISDIQTILMAYDPAPRFSIEVTSPSLTEGRLTTIVDRMKKVFESRPDLVVSRVDSVDQYRDQVKGSSSTLIMTGGLGLLASSVGILNVGLSSLQQRSLELSLRRAMGAKRWHISWIMFLESQIVAITAGVFAIPLSFFFYPIVLKSFGAPIGIEAPAYPLEYALLGVLIGMTASFVGSIVPAIRALSVPIIGIVRE